MSITTAVSAAASRVAVSVSASAGGCWPGRPSQHAGPNDEVVGQLGVALQPAVNTQKSFRYRRRNKVAERGSLQEYTFTRGTAGLLLIP